MKILSGLFFLIISLNAQGQWQDAFDDAEFSSDPHWNGDTADFIVNPSLELQLNATIAGTSYLSTLSNPDMFNELEWRFRIQQSFSPSSGNYGRVYLVSDQSDLSAPLHGYYLQFGESLSNDAVELFRQDGTSAISVCRATDAAIAAAFNISIKVTRSNIGLWSLWIDYSGGNNFVLECYGAEAMYTSSNYFGVFCEYTSGNISKFYFDDFYVGPTIHDTAAPEISSVTIITSNSLELQFSEALQQQSANDISNYSVDGGIGNPTLALLSIIDPTKVVLDFALPFVSAFEHTLTIDGIQDLEANIIAPGTNIQFTFFPLVHVEKHDVIFTEIMFEPSSSAALPNFEFIELYNRTSNAIPLKNWSVSDGSSTAIFPERYLLSHEYLILCNTTAASAFAAYGSTIGLTSFPVLNNDVGDHLQLFDANGYLIEELSFSNETYRDGNKDDGGYSLERIDTNFLCVDPLNWMASFSSLGGTPGKPSSVSGIYTDNIRPQLLHASLIDSVRLRVSFSEGMDEANILDPLLYEISGPGQSAIHPDSVMAMNDPMEYQLRLPFAVEEGVFELSAQFGLKDCPGNDLDISQKIRFAFPKNVEPGDIVINEVLFNPQSGGNDFVELFNRSGKVLDILRWRIAEAPYNDLTAVQASKSIREKQHLFFSGEYILLSKNSSDVRQRYENPGIKVFVAADDLPDFNSTEGAVVLYDSLGNVLDLFNYSEKMHFPLLIDKKGVSLERLSPEMASDETSNWHSASSSSGFATPGYKNSIGWNNAVSSIDLSIDPSIFSPDNDGYNDLLSIRLKQSGRQGIAKVLVFDINGRLVRELAQQAIMGDEFVVLWDGLNDKGELASIGTYILYAEVFHANGDKVNLKKACALTLK
jgi:hypothetical protein